MKINVYAVVSWLMSMNDQGRRTFLDTLKSFFCLDCGGLTPHHACYCTRDE